ncbi:flagellar biosynthetic protein FliO [Tersicoccus sp. MR15.9]|uniref:FliO/MopB family protein n=1 Tax=Tersicoccus mangrovi TaxID=3121635 RepID=UPI002FE5AEF0
MDSFVLGLRVLVSLGAVLGLIWVLQRRVKRRGGLVRAAGPAISVLSRQGIGHKASVVLLDADGQRLLLGVTEHGVSVLRSAEATPAAEPVQAAAAAPAAGGTGSFASTLSAATATFDDATASAAAPFGHLPSAPSRFAARRSASSLPTAALPAAAKTPPLDLPAGTAAVTTSFSGPDHGSILLAATAPAVVPVADPSSTAPSSTAPRTDDVRPRGRHAAAVPVSTSPLSGSILDLNTWRQARDAARWVAGGRRS